MKILHISEIVFLIMNLLGIIFLFVMPTDTNIILFLILLGVEIVWRLFVAQSTKEWKDIISISFFADVLILCICLFWHHIVFLRFFRFFRLILILRIFSKCRPLYDLFAVLFHLRYSLLMLNGMFMLVLVCCSMALYYMDGYALHNAYYMLQLCMSKALGITLCEDIIPHTLLGKSILIISQFTSISLFTIMTSLITSQYLSRSILHIKADS